MSVCLSGTNLSGALNLHHSGSDLRAVIKGSSRSLEEVFKGSSSNLQAKNIGSFSRSLNYFVLLALNLDLI